MAAHCPYGGSSSEAEYGSSSSNKNISLARVLKIFTSPVSEEQAWAICHQCAKYFLNGDSYHNGYRTLVQYRIDALHIRRDGEVVVAVPEVNKRDRDDRTFPPNNATLTTTEFQISDTDDHFQKNIVKEKDVIQVLGLIVYQALDYGLSETEEHHLSSELESLIEYMTNPGEDDEASDSQTIDDEGIVNDDEDDHGSTSMYNFDRVLQICKKHLSNKSDAVPHYRAVCRALFAEAHELVVFLDKVSVGQKILQKQRVEVDQLDNLERSDWARLWIQIMKQLRHGVNLKKVDHCAHSLQGEYELTPYEILMKDIVFKRYRLNKIMVNGDIPPKVKHDAHIMILDFIRSRPPLHPMKDRVMNSLPPRSPDPHEKLLIDIRAQPKLRPIKEGKVLVETSRTKLNLDDEDESPLPVRKVIRPDFNLILDNSFEVEDEDFSRDGTENKDVVRRSGKGESATDRNAKLVRRHTIMVCESPTESKVSDFSESLQTVSELDELSNDVAVVKSNSDAENVSRSAGSFPTDKSDKKLCTNEPKASTLMHVSWNSACSHIKQHPHDSPRKDYHPLSKKWQNPIECLSLTLDEVMHIRQVLTKAELESLITQPQLYDLVSRGKLCFSCKSVKFSLFTRWGNNCQFCRRVVCNKCIRKMRIPTEHFNKIPVYTLSPSPPVTPIENTESLSIFSSSSMLSPKKKSGLKNGKSPKRRPLQRSQTIADDKPIEHKAKAMRGSLLNICCDCKCMICEVIQASRVSISLVGKNKDLPTLATKSSPQVNFKTDPKEWS